MDFSDPNFSFETYQRAKLGLSMIPNSIRTNIAETNSRRVQQFLEYLYDTKFFKYVENLDDSDFIIAASEHKPKFTSTNVTFDITSYDIFEHIKFYAKKLLPSIKLLKDYEIEIKNYAIIYCDRDTLRRINTVILNTYKIIIIPIYSDELLYFDYINNYIDYDFKLFDGISITDRLWRPYMDTGVGEEKKYNIIIEKIMKLNFELLNRYNIPDWDFKVIYQDIKRDEDLELYNTDGKNPFNKTIEQAVCEDYLYQLWLFYTNILRHNNSLTSLYKKTTNNTNPGIFDVLNVSDKVPFIGGNLTLELSNENEINQIISLYANKLSSNQKKYLKKFHSLEQIGLLRTLDILTVVELKKNMDERQSDIIDLYNRNNDIINNYAISEKNNINLIIGGVITLAVIILSLLILVLRKNMIEMYKVDE